MWKFEMNKPMRFALWSPVGCEAAHVELLGLGLITVNWKAAPEIPPPCLHFFKLLYLWREGASADVIGEIFVTEWNFIFLCICWTNGNVQSDIYVCLLRLPFFPPPPFLPMSVFQMSWIYSKGRFVSWEPSLKSLLHFKGAIAVKLSCAGCEWSLKLATCVMLS